MLIVLAKGIFNLTLAMLLAGLALLFALQMDALAPALAGITLALVGTIAGKTIFYTLPGKFLRGQADAGGTGVLNRTMWKYQDWLAGFNGGPLRAPAMRVPDRFMKSLRQGLVASGLPVTSDPDSAFMIGRYPC